MRAVIQRVKHSSVTVDGKVLGEIGNGLLVTSWSDTYRYRKRSELDGF